MHAHVKCTCISVFQTPTLNNLLTDAHMDAASCSLWFRDSGSGSVRLRETEEQQVLILEQFRLGTSFLWCLVRFLFTTLSLSLCLPLCLPLSLSLSPLLSPLCLSLPPFPPSLSPLSLPLSLSLSSLSLSSDCWGPCHYHYRRWSPKVVRV